MSTQRWVVEVVTYESLRNPEEPAVYFANPAHLYEFTASIENAAQFTNKGRANFIADFIKEKFADVRVRVMGV